jgi:uncharacterized protein (TIGR02996 family)
VSDRAALYAAILAHPDDDTPRLVFADWLQENGNERYATFIRKQIELAKVPEWDPLWAGAWYTDRDALTGRGYDDFRPALGEGLNWEPLDSFRRGFPWRVATANPGPFLEHAARLFAGAPLGAVRFGHEHETWRAPYQVDQLVASRWLARLTDISFNVARFTPDTAKAFVACPHLGRLKSLTFDLCTHDRGALRDFLVPALLDKLEAFELLSSESYWTELVVGLTEYRGPGRLRTLAVSPFNLGAFSHNQVFGAPVLGQLRELSISRYEMGAAHVRAVCGAPFAPHLESLSLSRTKPGVPGVAAIAECAALRGLKRLNLANNALGPLAMKRLAAVPHLANLSTLVLTSNSLGDKGATELAKAPWLKNLVSLELMHCSIGPSGALALGEALDPDRLIYLNVHSDTMRGSAGDNLRTTLKAKFGPAVFV